MPVRELLGSPETLARTWDALAAAGVAAVGEGAWRHLLIRDGLPWLPAAASEKHLPQMLNLDRLDGVSFTKGCYPGQEIVARTRYLGRVKRRLYAGRCETAERVPVGATLHVEGSTQPDAEVLFAGGSGGRAAATALPPRRMRRGPAPRPPAPGQSLRPRPIRASRR